MPGYVPNPPTVLTQGGDTTDHVGTAVYTTGSFTPTPNRTQLLGIAVRRSAQDCPAPTVTGCGLTWVLEKQVIANGTPTTNNLYLFKARGPLAANGTLTISFPIGAGSATYENVVWIVAEFGGIDLNPVQSNAHDAGVTVATSETNTLGAFSSSDNGTFGLIAVMFNANSAITQGSGFTEIAEQLSDDPTPSCDLRIQMQSKVTNDTSVDWTFVNVLNARVMSIACELDWNPVDATHLRYFGGGHLLYLNALTVPRYSNDYGVSWGDAAIPTGGAGTYPECKAAWPDAANERIWSIWTNSDTGGGIALCYSTTFGATWIVNLEISGASRFVTDIATHPSDTNRIAAVGGDGSNALVWTTQDRGANWTLRTGPAVLNAISYQPIVSGSSAYITWTPYGRLIISTGGRLANADGDLYYSDDLGVTWTKATVPSPAPNRNWNVQLFRVNGFGPYFMLYGDEATGAAASALLRSDDHGASWISRLTPNTTESFAGLQYDAKTDTLLLSTPEHVYGLRPSASDDAEWTDLTRNFYDVALSGQYVFQPFAFVGDPQRDG